MTRGGRSTANVNKNTDQLGGLADKATDQARTLPNTSKGSPTTLPNKAARQRNESKRSPAM
jgi:hypothetical protein